MQSPRVNGLSLSKTFPNFFSFIFKHGLNHPKIKRNFFSKIRQVGKKAGRQASTRKAFSRSHALEGLFF